MLSLVSLLFGHAHFVHNVIGHSESNIVQIVQLIQSSRSIFFIVESPGVGYCVTHRHTLIFGY